tara:strand:+ start:221409 stop:221762 length:354 start_codon:yes stop_codon:yes gene_type:complete
VIRADIRNKLDLVKQWLGQHELLEWVEPGGGVVCFPRMPEPRRHDIDAFYHSLLADHATYVGAGHWFAMPCHYFRLGYGWPGLEELHGGLANIDKALSSSLRPTGAWHLSALYPVPG